MTTHFTFFESYYEAVKNLDAEIKAEYYQMLFEYALYDKMPIKGCSPIPEALFKSIKPNLDKSKARREAGKQGGSKREAKRKQTPSKPKQTPSDKDKDKDKEIGVLIPKGINIQAWEEFEQHRKEIGKPLSKLSRTKNFNILLANPNDQQEMVDLTIQSRWAGLFPPKSKKQNHQSNQIIDDFFSEQDAEVIDAE